MTHAVDAGDTEEAMDAAAHLVGELADVSETLAYLSNSVIVPHLGCFPLAKLNRKSYNIYVDLMFNLEREITRVQDVAIQDTTGGGNGDKNRRYKATMFLRVIEKFYTAPLRQEESLLKHVSKPVLLTRLMKLLTDPKTTTYVALLDDEKIEIYRNFETSVRFYADQLESDQAAYE